MSSVAQLDFRILGPLEVHEDGRVLDLHRRKQRALLAFLLLHAGEWLSPDALIEALWGERSPKTARSALQNYVAQLRHLLGRAVIETREGGYQLRLAPQQLDLARFERLLAEAQTAEPAERLERLREALALWRGPPLADLLYEPFADREAARLEELHVAALEELIDSELALGLGTDEIERLEGLVAEHPYRERLRAELMLALYRSDRQVDALECYRQARSTLSEELGIEPGTALRELEQAILRQDTSLEPPAPELAAAVPLAERRKRVTVLFAELRLPPELDPELWRSATARALTRVRRVLAAHGGTIEQRGSDELLAVFGLPRAHEDDALRAARAALELQAEAEVELRLALESGEVLAGVDEAGHGFVSGAVVPGCRRLLEHARPGEVLVGEAALAFVGGAALTTAAAGGAQLLVRIEEELAALATPLADRTQELAGLRAAFDAAVNERHFHIVLLLGEAGIGKTRLAAELTNELEGQATIARGRCLSYGQALTYWPLVEPLRSLGEPAKDALELLLAGGATSPQQLARIVQQALGRAATERPLLLLIEDLHWAEPALVDLLCGLSAEAPILLLCMARPELLEEHPDWAQQERVPLGPLPRPDAAALLGALESPPPADDRERVLERAAGNPLFLEELSAFLGQGGTAHELPPRIQVLLQARLELLPEPQRLLLATAAVEGTVFHLGALEALLPEAGDIESRLSALGQTLLIRPWSGDVGTERGYRFRHQLIRDTAYASLPKTERARLHERFADWLDASSGARAELEDVAAYHLEQAALGRRELETADPALESRAADALAAAAERANRRADYHAAVGLWRRSLALLAADDPRTPALELELAIVLARLGGFGEARSLFADAERRAVDPCLAAHVRLARLSAQADFEPEGAPAAIRLACEEAIPVFEQHRDHRALARAWYALAEIEWCETQMQAAERALATAAAHAHRVGDRALEIVTLTSRAAWLGTTRWPLSRTLGELERLAARFPGEPAVERHLGLWRAFAAYEDGRPEDGRALARESLDRVRREDSPMTAESFAMFFSHKELMAGDVDRAERHALDAVGALQERGVGAFLGTAKVILAGVRVAQDRSREALELTDEGERIGGSQDRQNLVAVNAVRARAHAQLSEADEALSAAAEAIAVAELTDSLSAWAVAQEAHAEALLAAGELGAALAAATEAERLQTILEKPLSRAAVSELVEQIERRLVPTTVT